MHTHIHTHTHMHTHMHTHIYTGYQICFEMNVGASSGEETNADTSGVLTGTPFVMRHLWGTWSTQLKLDSSTYPDGILYKFHGVLMFTGIWRINIKLFFISVSCISKALGNGINRSITGPISAAALSLMKFNQSINRIGRYLNLCNFLILQTISWKLIRFLLFFMKPKAWHMKRKENTTKWKENPTKCKKNKKLCYNTL